MALKFRCIL